MVLLVLGFSVSEWSLLAYPVALLVQVQHLSLLHCSDVYFDSISQYTPVQSTHISSLMVSSSK